MAEYEISRIGIGSLTKIYATITVAFTVLFGWPVLFLDVAIPGVGIASFLVMVLFAVVGGVVAGALTALLYNLIAAGVGGLVVDLAHEHGEEPVGHDG